MKERPILFSAPMVRAILESRKTVTRRVVKVPDQIRADRIDPSSRGPGWFDIITNTPYGEDAEFLRCPYGQPGDRLWVRESCRAYEIPDADYDGIHHPEPGTDGVRYQADDAFREIENTQEASDAWLKLWGYRGGKGEWVRSIHMPRWASRITLEITGVRVERLQEISSDEARAEGVEWDAMGWADYEQPERRKSSSAQSFETLWRSINGADSWAANPLVWCVSFRRIEVARAAA